MFNLCFICHCDFLVFIILLRHSWHTIKCAYLKCLILVWGSRRNILLITSAIRAIHKHTACCVLNSITASGPRPHFPQAMPTSDQVSGNSGRHMPVLLSSLRPSCFPSCFPYFPASYTWVTSALWSGGSLRLLCLLSPFASQLSPCCAP